MHVTVKSFFVTAIILLALVVFFLLNFKEKHEFVEKTLRFSFAVKNTTNKLKTDLQIYLPYPEMNLDLKNGGLVAIDLAGGNLKDGLLALKMNALSPFAVELVSYTVKVAVNVKSEPQGLANKSSYLNDEPFLNLSSESVQFRAKQIGGNTSSEVAKNIFVWLSNNITQGNYSEQSKGAEYLLRSKQGDCTEISYAFVALARLKGVAARTVRGLYVERESQLINASDFHDWAEFYDGSKWILVDPQLKNFDRNYENYIHLKLVNDAGVIKRFSSNDSSINVVFE